MTTRPEAETRFTVLAFMALTTGLLVSYAFAETARGLAGVSGMLVYGMAAAFGLEFLGSSWAARWKAREVEPIER